MRTMVLVYKNLHDWVICGVNVRVHIPAPWSIWDMQLISINPLILILNTPYLDPQVRRIDPRHHAGNMLFIRLSL